jgi:1,4-alpha-glucan branching enzyme
MGDGVQMWNAYDAFKQYAVTDVSTVAEFLKKYTKYDRHEGRGQEYAENRLKNYQVDFDKEGFVWMTRHDSVTGQMVSFYKIGKPKTPRLVLGDEGVRTTLKK